MATVKYRFEYRINKKGCEIYRSEILPDVLETFRRLNEKRPGVYSLQRRDCRIEKYGVLAVNSWNGKNAWSPWQNFTVNLDRV